MNISPIVVAMVVRQAASLVGRRGPALAETLIAARHPDSDGGRRLTKGERKAIARAILRGAGADVGGDQCES